MRVGPWARVLAAAAATACADDGGGPGDDGGGGDGQEPPADCPAPTPSAALDLRGATRLAVAIYHFNIQYVAGGLQGFAPGDPAYDLDEAELEDRIVRQGLEPLLDLYLANPDLGADVELQGLMVDVIAARHPDVLAKMRDLAERRQVDFDSFHWSDQLWLAYGRRDMEVSLDMVRQSFDRACLPLGGSVFTQEGQFAAGQIPLAGARGYTVSVLPKNLLRYQLGDDAAEAGVLFDRRETPGHFVLVGGVGWAAGPDAEAYPFALASTFMGDGEIALAQGELPPYFGTRYAVDAGRVAERAAELRRMADDGWRHVTVAQAVAAMVERGVEVRPLPPLMDGTWQPEDTGNVHRWMGGAGLRRSEEADAEVLSAVWRARRAVLAADARAPRAAPTRDAWRELLLAEVSDSTGWNPFAGEVEYALRHAAAALALAGGPVAAGAGAPRCDGDAVPIAEVGAEVIAPARPVEVRARRCEDGGVIELIVEYAATGADAPDESSEAAERDLEVRFARTGGDVAWPPALEGRMGTYRLDDYVFDEVGVPLPAGLISLGVDRWAVQDQDAGRSAALVGRTGDARGWVRFAERTVRRSSAGRRRWWVLEGLGPDAAMAFAKQVNGD